MKSYMDRISRFFRREDGLVAVEWVALTSGLVIGAIIIGVTVMDTAETQAIGMGTTIQVDGDTAACSAANQTFGLCGGP